MATVSAPRDGAELTWQVKEAARAVGFDLVGVSTIGPATHPDEFRRWLASSNHRPIRTDPCVRHPCAPSVRPRL
jgi:hypothetical protein